MKYQAIDSDYIREMKEYDEFVRDKKLMYKGIKYGYFIALFIIILSALFNGNLVLAQGSNDINYTFQNINLYNSTSIEDAESFNIRNQTEYTEDYNATYSFNGETGDSGTDVSFINYTEHSGTNYDIVVASENGRNEVLSLVDVEQTFYSAQIQHFFNPLVNIGTIEFWVNAGITGGGRLFIQLWNITGDRTIQLEMADDFKYNVLDDSGVISDIASWENETWNHISFDYDNTISQCIIYVNGMSLGTFTLISDGTVYKMAFITRATGKTNASLDDIGFSWDPFYTIGDNIVPNSITNTSIQEPDKWEFSFTEDGEAYSGPSPVPFWDEIGAVTESGSGKIVLTCDDDSTKGIGRGDFTVLDGILNITLNLEFQQIYTSEAINYLDIYSADDTLITRLRWFSWSVGAPDFYKSMLSYYNGSDYVNITVVVHKHITTPKTENNFNLFINSGICVLRNETTLLGIFPTISDEKGLSRVNFTVNGGQYCDGETNVYGVHIHSIGIYSNGTSISDDYFSLNWEIGEDWDSNDYSFFKSYVIGNYSISAIGDALVSYTLYPKAYYSEVSRLSVLDWFTGEGAPEEYLYLENCNISIISDEVIVFNYFYIEGIRLVEGINEYTPTFSNENVNTNESYFYVSGNNLYFTMTSNDTDLEYMEITFDIDNIVASNRSLKYSGVKSASSLEAQFKVNYVDSSYNPFELEPDYVNLAVLLPRTKTIDTFGLLISDNDNDVNDTITGFIGSFELLYVPLIATDFVSISFFDALPIVVLVVIIPIALYVGFGRKKEILVPSIIAMSIFGTAVGLIPLWLTFVIGFGCVSYFIMDRRN